MREFLEIRVNEKYANLIFRPNEGNNLGPPYLVRKIIIEKTDSRFNEIGRIQNELVKRSSKLHNILVGRTEYLFHGWKFIRKYTKSEISRAELFTLTSSTYFEPAGEECGTVYDESIACPKCGSGARQVGPLFMQVSKLPKGKDFATTIANEHLVSHRAVQLFKEYAVTGVEFGPVMTRTAKSEKVSSSWYQIIIKGDRPIIDGSTISGNRPFDFDVKNEYRCQACDKFGLNILSEFYVKKDSKPFEDFSLARQYVGIRMGLLRPYRQILVLPKVREIIMNHGLKGAKFEVAHLV